MNTNLSQFHHNYYLIGQSLYDHSNSNILVSQSYYSLLLDLASHLNAGWLPQIQIELYPKATVSYYRIETTKAKQRHLERC